jgi:protein-disulfide isomerase
MQRELFRTEQLGSISWSTLADYAGISDTLAFAACMKSDEANAVLERHLRAAKILGVVGTPTIVVGHDVYVGTPNGFGRIVHSYTVKAGLE